MKKRTLFVSLIGASACILFSCGQQKAASTDSESNADGAFVAASAKVNTSTVDSTAILNPQVAQEMEQFISATYTDVFAAYSQANKQGDVPNRSDFDKKYLTERLQAEINSAEMIDCDYWLQAQDFTTPVFEVKGIHVSDDNNGYVYISIKVFGEETTTPTLCRVIVQKANGNWKIDNFKSPEN